MKKLFFQTNFVSWGGCREAVAFILGVSLKLQTYDTHYKPRSVM